MTPEEFIDKWRGAELKESAAYQEHFVDLCHLLEVPTPAQADKKGVDYAFQKHVSKNAAAGKGFADVWKKGCFIWEYKGDARNLVRAYGQAREYADFLGNPPLIVVSDMKEIRVHTAFNNAVSETTTFTLGDLTSIANRRRLRAIFEDPESWRPTVTPEQVTSKAAEALAVMANKLRRNYEPRRVAHFLNKLVFCMFAEDIGLLPDDVFSSMVEDAGDRPQDFTAWTADLFNAMRRDHGRFDRRPIPWFNGGLFDDDDVLAIGGMDIKDVAVAAKLDWRNIEPSIFGTLFEKGLDPERRAEMAGLFDGKVPERVDPRPFERGIPDKGVGIHYTDPATIMKIVEPVVLRPLREEWNEVKAAIKKLKRKADKDAAYLNFRERLGKFRVLDPACGSGNFLYLALLHLKDFDLKVSEEAAKLDLTPDKIDQRITPDNLLGIEINPYAAELARVTVWIGDLQWQYRNKLAMTRRPILGKLGGIVCKDALIDGSGKETEWPVADAIIGNPPFLGDKMMIGSLGEEYVTRLRKTFEGRVPGGADLVCYWFEKARAQIEVEKTSVAGLVATNSIRGGRSRAVLDRIVDTGVIFDAWSDDAWVLDGAAVRVSLVCFSKSEMRPKSVLNGAEVSRISPDLKSDAVDLTKARKDPNNLGASFVGIQKTGPFDIPGKLARGWLQLPKNPNRRPNADVLMPYWNGLDLTRRPRDFWLIDFPLDKDESYVSAYEAPYEYAFRHIKHTRVGKREARANERWWEHYWPRPEMRQAIARLPRYIVTPEVSKFRLFVWLTPQTLPDKNLIIIARDDDCSLGILQSRFHEQWAVRLGTSLEDRPRYTSSSTFETFPFPSGLTPNTPATNFADDPRAMRIAAAAKQLNELRENWLNPPDLVRREPEVMPGYPDRILPVNDRAAAELKKRTLTNLYNQRPQWLANAHKQLDVAVAAAYGWPEDISDEEALKRLFDLNQERAKNQMVKAKANEG